MTTRKMTNKMFLHRAAGKAAINASAFLAQHREFLQTGELALFAEPILLQVDSREILPTPALERIKEVVLAHHLADEIRIAQDKMEAADQPTERKTSKSYVARIYDSKTGEVVQVQNEKGKTVDLEESFDNSFRAEGWTDRRLFDGAVTWFGVVEATKLFRQDGTPFTATILRVDAIGRILKVGKGPVMKAKPKSTNKLGFGVKCKPSHASFSRG